MDIISILFKIQIGKLLEKGGFTLEELKKELDSWTELPKETKNIVFAGFISNKNDNVVNRFVNKMKKEVGEEDINN